MRALIVDDCRTARVVLSGILKDLGFDVFEAPDGRAGLALLRELGGTDLALVDWNMPQMDGCAFVRAVRANEHYQRMRVVMVTAETDGTRMAQVLEAGADEYVMKPFTREILQGKLALVGLSPLAP